MMPDVNGVKQPVHYHFLDDSTNNHPSYPKTKCPVLIIHGTEDPIVPIETSRIFVEQSPSDRQLEEVVDGHDLIDSLDFITDKVISFLELDEEEEESKSKAMESSSSKL